MVLCLSAILAIIACSAGPVSQSATTRRRIFSSGRHRFPSEGRNGNGPTSAATLNVPTGVAVGGGLMAEADAWNHRVLLWRGYPRTSHAPADIVLGQEDFASTLANRGSSAPTAATLHWPYGVAIIGERLFVADTGNRRVLVWNAIPQTHGAPADLVLGQKDFETRDDNAGDSVGAGGMRWPHAMAMADNRLFLADAGNNRVMVWNALPTANGAPCDFVLGQTNFAAAEHNASAYNPTAATFNMPYGVAVRDGELLIADTANSRLLGSDEDTLRDGRDGLAPCGPKRVRRQRRQSLAAACARQFVLALRDGGLRPAYRGWADSGNNRVLLWRAG